MTPRRRGEPRGVLAAAGPPLDGPKAPSPYSRIHTLRPHSLPHAPPPPPQLLFAHGGREREAVAEAVDLVVYGVEVERPERRERREGIKERGRGREHPSRNDLDPVKKRGRGSWVGWEGRTEAEDGRERSLFSGAWHRRRSLRRTEGERTRERESVSLDFID